MNEISGYARPVPAGYWAMCRFHRDGRPKPAMNKGGNPIVYPTEAEALRAVVKHLCAYMNTTIRRDGEVLKARSEGDAHFPTLKPIRRNGRVIPVERARA